MTGRNTVDTFFNLNITWLRDANVNGPMTWAQASTWATGYTIGAYGGWRLSTVTDVGNDGCNYSFADGTDCGYNVNTAASEMPTPGTPSWATWLIAHQVIQLAQAGRHPAGT